MKITYESELMKNQEHADVMSPDVAFEVIYATNGDALFFSVGTDKVFYVTREVRESTVGWDRVDLSSSISNSHSGAAVAAKTFAITLNPNTQSFDVALIVTIAGSDWLYVSPDNSGSPDAWKGEINWTAIPFDASGISPPTPFAIADVYLMQIPSGDGLETTQNFFIDIVRNPYDPLQALDRYYIQLGCSPQWYRHTLPADMSAGSVHSCLGMRTNDYCPGIYTFGKIGGSQQLLFTPQYNVWSKTVPPRSARLEPPNGAGAIASALNSDGLTNLFVSGSSGLYVFAPDKQHDQDDPALAITNSVFAGTSSLSAATAGSRTAVWALNGQGDLIYASCPAGSETKSDAWTAPIAICTGAEDFAFYLNPYSLAAHNVLFAHVSGQKMLILKQDPTTGTWSQGSILLPSTDLNDVAEFWSFTTHVQTTDDAGRAAPNTPVTLTSTTAVTLYVNAVYHILSPGVGVQVTADETGVLTVVQRTESLRASCFTVASTDIPSVLVAVNPMAKLLQILGTIKSGDDLGNVQITTASGKTQPLLSPSLSEKAKNDAANAIGQLVQVSASVPADGSRQSSQASTSYIPNASFLGISIDFGSLFQSIENAWDTFEDFFVTQVGGEICTHYDVGNLHID